MITGEEYLEKLKNEKDAKLKKLNGKFDRVLADVPCSGTGTFRRNPDLKWKNSMQLTVHFSVI